MPVQVSGQVGPQRIADGTGLQPIRQGNDGDVIVSELHGRFYESNYRGAMFAAGLAALTAINNVTFTLATLGATCTPILGVWNPLGSNKNLALSQAILNAIVTAATSTGPGGFVWAAAINQGALSLGGAPFNRKTLQAAGSVAKNLSGIALTGLSGNLTVLHGSGLGGGSLANFSFVGTAAGEVTAGAASVENFDGSFIVPPGGVLALLATTTPVAHSATGALVWEEVPV